MAPSSQKLEPPAIPGRFTQTRERILDIAETAVLQKGFGATSIDELIAEAGLTKSGFFYHFKDKSVLAQALLQRYLDREEDILDDLFARAAELSEDPLHAFLIGLKLFAEMMNDLPAGHPGCLVATYCYHEQLFDKKIQRINHDAVLFWRNRFRSQLNLIADKYPPRDDVDIEALADMVSSVIEGGIIVSKVLKDPKILAGQIMLFRSYLRLLFLPDN